MNKLLPIFDRSSSLILKAKLLEIDNHKLIGKALDLHLPHRLKELFRIYEERVNQNILSDLDRIEEEIQSYGFYLKFNNEAFVLIDMQLMNGDEICFEFRDGVPVEIKENYF